MMAAPHSLVHFALFPTVVGDCAIAWGAHGICGVQLPEADAAATRQRMHRRFPGVAQAAPSPEVLGVIDGIAAMLRGDPHALDTLVFDMRGVPPFHQRVYEVARSIPPGQTLTYGEVAARLGEPGAARAVGQALGRNPFAPVVPCHRVLAAGDKPGGFSAAGGIRTKLRLLINEGAMRGTPGLFD